MAFTTPVVMDPRKTRPRMDAGRCECCTHPAARWDVVLEFEDRKPTVLVDGAVEVPASPDWTPMCARCWLYASSWGRAQCAAIAALVRAVESHMGTTFAHGDDGKLLLVEDCDRILSSVALTSRIFHVVDKKKSE